MSNLDTILNIDQSLKLRGISKLSKAQLAVALQNNIELQQLRNQLSNDLGEINNLLYEQNQAQLRTHALQEQILKNQIKEIEHRETLAFYKNRIFHCKEYLNDFNKLTDDNVKAHFRTSLLPYIDQAILESKEKVEEIRDKEFCMELQNEIYRIKNNKEIDSIINPIVESLGQISNKFKIEHDIFFNLIDKENKLIKNQNEKIKYVTRKIEKKREIFAYIRRLIAFCSLVIIIQNLSPINYVYLLLSIILLILSVGFEFQYLMNKKNMRKKIRERVDVDISQTEIKKLAELKKDLRISSHNLEKLSNQYYEIYKSLFELHPEFKIIDYTIQENPIEYDEEDLKRMCQLA